MQFEMVHRSTVIAWDFDEENIYPRFLIGDYEIVSLMKALEAEPDRDAWEIVVEVNKRIRAEEN